MALTKPAGVAVQLIGGVFLIGGLARLFMGFSFAAAVAMVVGLTLMWQGRRPARSAK